MARQSGCELALVLASDRGTCSASAHFNVAFVRIGISGCDVGTSWLLPRIVGVARAQELILIGRLIDAEEALRIGLVVDVASDEDLLDTAMTKAEEIIDKRHWQCPLRKRSCGMAWKSEAFSQPSIWRTGSRCYWDGGMTAPKR